MRRLLQLVALPAALAFAPDAHASGGLVTSPQGASSIAEVEVAIAASPGHTVRWARIRVKGNAGAFVWLVPVRPGAMIDLASDAWIESLGTATVARVLPPTSTAPCDVKGGVDVTARIDHVATRAPSDVAIVTDDASLAIALHDWGFVLPTTMGGAVEATFASGSRLALLLFSPSSTDTTTRTIRVIDDAPPVLPLVLTGSATDDVQVTAFVVDEARTDVGLSPMLSIDPTSLGWRADGTSSWRDARAAALGASPDAWLLESAGSSSLFNVHPMPDGTIDAIADGYFARAGAYGDVSADATSCMIAAHGASTSPMVVAPACPRGALARVDGANGPVTCIESTQLAEIAPDPFRCGAGADDLAHAFAKRVPGATWVTRATGIVPRGLYGQNAPVAPGSGAVADPIVRASKYDVVCSTEPGGGGGGGGIGGGGGGNGGSGGPPLGGSPTGGGALVGTDDTTVADTAAGVGDSCGGFADDGCGGDSSSSSDDSSGGSCSSSSGGSSESSGCGGSSTPSDTSGGGCGGGSSDCTTSRPSKRSPFSRWALGGLAIVALLRRTSRRGGRPVD